MTICIYAPRTKRKKKLKIKTEYNPQPQGRGPQSFHMQHHKVTTIIMEKLKYRLEEKGYQKKKLILYMHTRVATTYKNVIGMYIFEFTYSSTPITKTSPNIQSLLPKHN
jgi:hypothetical protein